jgi:2-hydroxychromene-2-carboxylate isomerase
MHDAVIEYFYSLSSPWAYLGGPRLQAIAARHRVRIEHRPITVLDENGGIRLRTRPEPRQRYHEIELDRWHRHLGLPLNLRPASYPTEPKPAALLVIAAARQGRDPTALSHALLRALWAEEADYADDATLARIASGAGFDGAALLAASHGDDAEAAWQANRAEAIARGMFGTPNYVFQGEIFWGQDRLDFLDRAIGMALAPASARGR